MTEAIKLMIDNKPYRTKPNSVGAVNNRIIHHPRTTTVEELAHEIVSGKTFMGSLIDNSGFGTPERKKEFWKSQQVVALDFDNEKYITDIYGKKQKVKDIQYTYEKALSDDFFNKYAAFIYKTFSCTKDHPKFRVVFVFNKPFYNLKSCESFISKLLELYPMADQSCSDGVRLFFGGSNLHVYDYSNRLPVEYPLDGYTKGKQYIYPTQGSRSSSSETVTSIETYKKNSNEANTYISNKSKSIHNNIYPKNIDYIKNRNIEALHNLIKPVSITLYNNNQVCDYINEQDLRIFLGCGNRLCDIFHDEEKPSASIFQSNKGNGQWLYKCHSMSSPFVGTIFQIIEKLLNIKFQEAKEFLMEVYKITIAENETQRRLKLEIDNYKYMLQSDIIEEVYPNFFKMFNQSGCMENLYILLDLVKENLPANGHDPRLLFYHSINTLSKKFRLSTSSTGVRMNFLTFFKMIWKLEDKDIPVEILKYHKKNKMENKYKYRSTTYELRTYTYDFFEEIDLMCKEWLGKGLTTRTMNYEGILRNYGQAEADRVFPQDKGKEIPELHEDIVHMIEQITMEIIYVKGWATEKEVLENVKLYFKGQKNLKESLMKMCIGDMLDKYGLERIPTNKKIKEELRITIEQLPTSSFPKIIRKIR
ncbi:hypothetical protein [Peribacillus asahii]|uniref:hypothetical protein n=1 Tax=Peribacillus asahii TaxID=228899 RepID=UPI0037F6CDBC